ncbi:hypothetical protein DQ353_11455 [Arthrobacter sp. AQ5-05]|uniref:hypothetical protein n=1 Tax=Arthrobacter sp. AQ5-05 TaxID=2184581 RepID=UPI000DCEFFB5|nr:hypothetical protein [Arthrobacter sp. AQ5-05]RAX49175.1 hypothetical protein DQ353_11455 [Arthrobacter sp. AQ5-05]
MEAQANAYFSDAHLFETDATAGGREVTVARHENGLVVLTGAGLPGLGTTVHAAVDPQTRLLHAALHTAGHLVGFLGDERGRR